MKRFFRYQLRTSDVEGARAFYNAVLGNTAANIIQLHEQSVARGARPHWLGFLDVGEVESAAAAFVARGATPLGPKWLSPEGLEAAVVRDPGGAVIALARPAPPAREDVMRAGVCEVGWHLLNTNDVERAKVNYGELFGWEFKAPLDLGSHGVFHPFAWQPGQPAVGSMSDVVSRPGVHPHWLFQFRVDSLATALDAARAAGARIIGPFAQPDGEHIAICDDPQGAAFALRERRSPLA